MRPIVTVLCAALVLVLAACGGGSDEPGQAMVMVSTRDGDYAVFGMNADGSDQSRLTDERGDVETAAGRAFQLDPAWSPDGTKIAFASAREGSLDIYVMNADGTGTTRLTTDAATNDNHPTWSSDGSEIAFGRDEDDGRIYVMNADGTGVRRLNDDLAPAREPSWSPDGKWIAYARRAPGLIFQEIWVSAPDGSRARKVTSLEAKSYTPSWSPDGSTIAFSSSFGSADGDRYDIFSVDVSTGKVTRRVRSSEDAFEPAWSPDGSLIAFSRDGSIVTVDGSGTEQVLTDPAGNDSSPAYNPVPPPADG